MRRKVTYLIVFFLFPMIFFAPRVWGQGSTGTILGDVKDATGAAIAGSTVTLSSAETGLTRTASTEADGSFRFDAIPVGHYNLRAEKEGFKTSIQSDLTLTVAQQAVVNFVLEVGEVRQTVTATAEAPQISTTTSSLGGLVDEQRIADLPLNGRNYNALTLLQPGVSQLTAGNTAVLGQAGIVFSSNGAPVRSNNYMLDGAILNNYVNTSGGSAMGTTLGVDGIQEYRVITNSFAAEYGLDMGSQMLLVSKGGTNQFHGSGFEFLRNSALDARNYFDLAPSRLGGHRNPEFRRNNFGGSFGGPIRKDKTFFFATYEGLRQLWNTTNTTNVPEAGCHGPAGATILPGAGNCPSIPSATIISNTMAPFLQLYPIPNLTTKTYGYTFPQPSVEDYGQIRVDHAFSNSDTFFGRYTIDQAYTTTPYTFPNTTQTFSNRNQFLTLSESHVISSSMVNTARFSFSRTNYLFVNETTIPIGPPYSTDTGSTAFYPNGLPMAQMSVSGETNIGTNALSPKIGTRNVFTGTDDLNYTKGKHSFKFGVMFNHYQDHIHSEGMDKGSIAFTNVQNFMTGLFQTFTEIPPANFDRYFHYDVMGFYAQDDWRVTQRLTLNLGMRYEPETTLTEVHGVQANYHNLLTDTAVTLGPYFRNPSLRNLGPRVGFAWDVFGDGKTALRGGYAILYDLATYGSELNNTAQYSPPFTNLITVNQQVLNSVPYIIPTNIQPAGSYRGPVYQMQQAHMMQYNLTFERQLPAGMALTVAYAGSRGIDLLQYKEGNPELPNGIPVGSGTAATCGAAPAGTVINTASQISGQATSCWTSISAPRRNPVLPSMQTDPAGGDSFFNALEVGVNKRITHGLQFQSSYTWSHSIDDTADGQGGDEGGSNYSAGKDALHGGPNRGPSNFDVTHNWRVNGIYHLPTFASSGLKDKLVNGWWGSAIFSLETGYPFDPKVTGNPSQDGLFATGQDYPNYMPGRNPGNISNGVSTGCGSIAAGTPLKTAALWFDPCGFYVPPEGFLGNVGRNILRGPGLTNLDFSIVKDTSVRALGEAGKIEFRAEIFNIANHTNLQTPITGSNVISGVISGANANAGVQNPKAPATTYLGAAGSIVQTILGPGNTPSERNIQFGLKLIF